MTPKQKEHVNQVLAWRKEAEDANRSIFTRMTKCDRFKWGGRRQWDPRDLAYNDRKKKHSITVNRIRPTVNSLSGHQINNPRDLTALPGKGANSTQARLVTALMKQISDSSYGLHQQSMCFDNGVTTARGYIGIETDYFTDPNGNLRLRKYNPYAVLPDRTRKTYDPNDWQDGWRYVFIDEWEPKAKVEIQFPGKKDALRDANYDTNPNSDGWIDRIWSLISSRAKSWNLHDDYRDQSLQEDGEDESDQNNKTNDHYRVSTCYWREWRKGAILRRLDMPNWLLVLHNPKSIERARRLFTEQQSDNIKLIEKDKNGMPFVVPVLMRTRMVGDVLLDETEDPFDGISMYPVVPYNAYFEDGQEFGIVDDLIGPQMVCNWSWSMALNIIKKVANPGWRIKSAMAAALARLEDSGDEDGMVFKEDDYGGKIERFDPPDYQGVAMLNKVAEQSAVHISESSNVRQERPEYDSKHMSGIAIARKQAASDRASAVLFRNWDMTREILGKVMIEHILRRGTYTLDEVKQIVDEEDLLDEKLLGQATAAIMQQAGLSMQPSPPPKKEQLALLTPYQQQKIIRQYQEYVNKYAQALAYAKQMAPELAIKMLWDQLETLQMRKTHLGVRSSLSEATSTFREAKFAQVLAIDQALRERGDPGFSRKLLLKASDMPYKDEALQEAVTTPAA